ncbi:Hypothetical protein POVN_LOCUS68 [uncultured virus]|nr:Hypothetical protein POVN_LOCUS68 [uncultured virus]
MEAFDLFMAKYKSIRRMTSLDQLNDLMKALDDGVLENAKAEIEEYIEHRMIEISPPITGETAACALPLIKGYNVGKMLGEGAMGKVYQLTDAKSGTVSDRLLKVAHLENSNDKEVLDEAKLATVAGELKIGPQVYGYTGCKVNRRRYTHVSHTVMQKLSGPELYNVYPYKGVHIEATLTQYYNLFVQTGILQNDLKGDNVMFDGDQLYLIDFGIAYVVKDKEKWFPERLGEHMKLAAQTLLDGLTIGSMGYIGRNVPWKNDTLSGRTRVWLELKDAAEKWLHNTFPALKLTPLENINGIGGLDSTVPEVIAYKALKPKPPVKVAT